MKDVRGMLLPLPTVFLENGAIDEPLMRELVDYYVDAGVNGLFVAGSFGQGPAMNSAERMRLADLVVSHANKRLPVIVHVGTADPYTTIELGRHALAKGADGVGLVGPYYYSDRTPKELRLHYRMVSAALGAPILLYNNPPYQGYPIGPKLMSELVEDSPNIFGAKLAMGSVDEARMYREYLGEDFKLFSLASMLFPGMTAGISGTVSPPLAVLPEIGVELVRAIDRKDNVRALELQQAVIAFHSAFLSRKVKEECGRAIYGEGLRELGFAVKKYPRWPTGEITEARRAWLKDLVRGARATLGRKAA
jgi:4-hydroxy-tetrahydrodipicolinate synthase